MFRAYFSIHIQTFDAISLKFGLFFSLESKTILPIRKMSILSVGLHHIKDYHQFVLLLNVFKHSPSIFFLVTVVNFGSEYIRSWYTQIHEKNANFFTKKNTENKRSMQFFFVGRLINTHKTQQHTHKSVRHKRMNGGICKTQKRRKKNAPPYDKQVNDTRTAGR